jgi:hypothetical protein
VKTPARWLDEPEELPEELVQGMRAYRALGPSAQELAQMRLGLRLRTASSTAAVFKWIALVSTVGALVSWAAWPAAQVAPAPTARLASEEARTQHSAPAKIEAPTPTQAAPVVVEAAPTTKRRISKRKDLPGPAADAAAELALLQRARRALAVAPATSLALTDEHARLYPQGAFAQERELIAIEALASTDRFAAIARARAFAARFPRSAHRERIEALLGER